LGQTAGQNDLDRPVDLPTVKLLTVRACWSASRSTVPRARPPVNRGQIQRAKLFEWSTGRSTAKARSVDRGLSGRPPGRLALKLNGRARICAHRSTDFCIGWPRGRPAEGLVNKSWD